MDEYAFHLLTTQLCVQVVIPAKTRGRGCPVTHLMAGQATCPQDKSTSPTMATCSELTKDEERCLMLRAKKAFPRGKEKETEVRQYKSKHFAQLSCSIRGHWNRDKTAS